MPAKIATKDERMTRPNGGWVDYQPEEATLVGRKSFSDVDALFEFELSSGEQLGHMPGQFVQVFVPGVGEAPFSVSSSPTRDGPFELCVRDVGKVTHAIHDMEVGTTVGIRGPYGKTCAFDKFKNEDLLFIAGGIGLAPMRSMVQFCLDHRDWYGGIVVLHGCKRPGECLFPEELEEWHQRDDLLFRLTFDEVPEGIEWKGHVGVITTLIPGLTIDPVTTYTFVCGPPVMYQFVQEELDKKEIPHDHIYLSLERRMHCGIGLCGHCQINDLYVCQDGPVFNYEMVKDRPEAL